MAAYQLFPAYKKGSDEKKKPKTNTLFKLNFSLCKHWLYPHPFIWSLSPSGVSPQVLTMETVYLVPLLDR